MDVGEVGNKGSGILKDLLVWFVVPALLVALVVNCLFDAKGKQGNEGVVYKLVACGNYDVAAGELEEQISEDFLNIELHRRYLRVQSWRTGEFSSVVEFETFRKYEQYCDSNDVGVCDIGYYGRGFFNSLLDNYDAALENYFKVGDCGMEFLNNSIGYVYWKLGDEEKAISYFAREIEVGGNFEGAYGNLARIYYENKDFEKLNGLIEKEDVREYISTRIYRVVLLKNGDVLGYLVNNFRFNYVTGFGMLASFLIAVIWFLYLRKVDVFEPEPVKFLLITFLMGMFFAQLCSIGYDFFDCGMGVKLHKSLLGDAVYCVFVIGFVEELVKIIPFLIMLRFTKQVNESIDYFVYASVSALGFAFMENLLYFQDAGLRAISGRALTAVFMHMSLTSVAAYGLFYSKYFLNNRWRLLCLVGSFFAAMVLHGCYDFWIISENVAREFRPFTFLTLMFCMVLYGGVLRKAVELSEFKAESRRKITKLSSHLFFGLSWVFMLQYLVMGIKFGAANANYGLKASVMPLSYLMLYMVVSLGSVGKLKKKKVKTVSEKLEQEYLEFKESISSSNNQSIETNDRFISPEDMTLDDFSCMKKEYENFKGIIIIEIFALAFCFTCAVKGLAWLIHVGFTRHEYVMLPSMILIAMPMFFLGMLTVAFLSEFVARVLGKKYYKAYKLYDRFEAMLVFKGYDPIKFFIFIFVLMIAFCVFVIIPLVLDYYVYVDDDSITVDRFWSLRAKCYSMDDVVSIDRVLSEKSGDDIKRSKHYQITFNDADVFKFDNDTFNYNLKQQRELMDFISERSGVAVSVKDPYPEK